MDFTVVFKDTFLADLERIVMELALHNPIAAEKRKSGGFAYAKTDMTILG